MRPLRNLTDSELSTMRENVRLTLREIELEIQRRSQDETYCGSCGEVTRNGKAYCESRFCQSDILGMDHGG